MSLFYRYLLLLAFTLVGAVLLSILFPMAVSGRDYLIGGPLAIWALALLRYWAFLLAMPHRVCLEGNESLVLHSLGPAFVHDLGTNASLSLETHGQQVTSFAWDPAGRFVVTGSRDGVVRVGPPTGEEPHLLFGHEGAVRDGAVGPQGRWIASASEDGTVRLWPLPLPERPLHTLPYEELLARLRSLTNFRVVPDRAAAGDGVPRRQRPNHEHHPAQRFQLLRVAE